MVFCPDACRVDQNGQYVHDGILVLRVANSYTRIKSRIIALHPEVQLRLASSECKSQSW